MSLCFETFVLLTVSGFSAIECTLMDDDTVVVDEAVLDTSRTSRPPHRIFFFENGDQIERVIDDGSIQMGPLMDSTTNVKPPSNVAGREMKPVQNFSGRADSRALSTGFILPSIGFNAFNGDSDLGVSNNPPMKDTARDYPSMILTPQQSFHIKVSIPKAHYVTRLYQGLGDVDIVEIVSKSNSVVLSQSGVDSNIINFGSQQPAAQNGFSKVFPNSASSQVAGYAGANQPIDNFIRRNPPTEYVFPTTPPNKYPAVQYNMQNGGLNYFNRQPDPSRFPASPGKGEEDFSQDYPHSNQLHGAQSIQTGQSFQAAPSFQGQFSQEELYPQGGLFPKGGPLFQAGRSLGPQGIQVAQSYNPVSPGGFQNSPNQRPNSLFFSTRFLLQKPTDAAPDPALRNIQPPTKIVGSITKADRSLDE